MRKLIFILSLVLLAGVSFGQQDLRVSGLKSSVDYTLNVIKAGAPEKFVFEYPTTTLTDADSLWSRTIAIDNSLDPLKATAYINLDRLTGTVVGVFYLDAKTFWDETAWTNTASSTISTSSDIKVTLTSATASPYRFYRVRFAGTNGTYTFKPSVFEFNVTK